MSQIHHNHNDMCYGLRHSRCKSSFSYRNIRISWKPRWWQWRKWFHPQSPIGKLLSRVKSTFLLPPGKQLFTTTPDQQANWGRGEGYSTNEKSYALPAQQGSKGCVFLPRRANEASASVSGIFLGVERRGAEGNWRPLKMVPMALAILCHTLHIPLH